MVLSRIFEEAVEKYPQNIAIDAPPSGDLRERIVFTYEQINNLSNFLATKITSYVKKDSVVAIRLTRNSHYVYVAQLAVLKAGAAYTCIDTSFPRERADFILDDSKACLLISEDDFLTFDDDKKIDIHEIDGKENIKTDFHSPKWLDENCLAYIIYTSGTTGKPKGVMIEHKSVCNLVLSDRDYFKLSSSDRMAEISSTSYDSSVEEIWLPFGCGGTLVVASDEVVRLGPDLGKWLRDERINVLCPPPTLLRMGVADDPENELPDLKLIYVGGEALPPEVVSKWAPSRWLENGYGPTECSITVTRTRIEEGKTVTIGKPVINNFAHILNENFEEVPKGKEGELCISGISLARGYLNREELTKEKFIHHPKFGRIYRTGDLVSLDENNDLHYHGRIDLQVKLRGYRVELGAVETVLKESSSVLDAACKVQETARGQILVGHIIPVPGEEVNFDVILHEMERKLPHYMLPNHFMLLEEMPISLSSGKLNRKALPDYIEEKKNDNREIIQPSNDIEKVICEEIKKILEIRDDISITDNFFELGGNSLSAAMVISRLRKNELTNKLTVRDIYDGPTPQEMAKKTNKAETSLVEEEVVLEGQPLLVTLFQFIWIIIGIIPAGLIGYFSMFYIFPYFLEFFGVYIFLLVLPLIISSAIFSYIITSMIMAVVIKWLLIGKYKEGEYPIWGSMYLRNWIVSQTVRLVPLGMLEGTEFKNFFFRLLGVKIGKGVYFQKGANVIMGGWDLLEIGDNVTIGREVTTRTIDYRYGKMIFGRIKIADNCTLETRSSMSINSEMKANCRLTGLSMLEIGGITGEGELWEGVPAVKIGENPEVPIEKIADNTSNYLKHGITLILFRTSMGIFTTIHGFIFTLLLIYYYNLDSNKIITWLLSSRFHPQVLIILCTLAVIIPFISLFSQAMFCRLIGRVEPGYYSRYSFTYIKMWLKDRMVEIAGNTLSGTLFWPYWLRLSGMKVGKNCEISTIIDVVPELISISDEVFFADGIYLGGPKIDRRVVYADEVSLSKNTFVGNHAIIPPGSKLPEDILLGICTVADKTKIKKGTSWFGHPSFELPQREVLELSRELTHNPAWYRYVTRVFWEALRFFLPIIPTLVMISWLRLTFYLGWSQSNLLFFGSTIHLITLGYLGFMASLIFVMKWGLLGKVKEGIHPLWSCWCSRWDFLYVAWAQYARSVLVLFEGTLILGWWLRLMGAKVGKRVMLGGGFAQVVDPDMLHFEDYSTVLCLFQAHSFEDRILKIAPVYIKKGATVGNSAVLLYGANIGEKTRVFDNSVVMKNEVLTPENQYVGCPTRGI